MTRSTPPDQQLAGLGREQIKSHSHTTFLSKIILDEDVEDCEWFFVFLTLYNTLSFRPTGRNPFLMLHSTSL